MISQSFIDYVVREVRRALPVDLPNLPSAHLIGSTLPLVLLGQERPGDFDIIVSPNDFMKVQKWIAEYRATFGTAEPYTVHHGGNTVTVTCNEKRLQFYNEPETIQWHIHNRIDFFHCASAINLQTNKLIWDPRGVGCTMLQQLKLVRGIDVHSPHGTFKRMQKLLAKGWKIEHEELLALLHAMRNNPEGENHVS